MARANAVKMMATAITQRLRMQCPSGVLQEALQGIALKELVVDGSSALIRCQRARKMDVLRRLGALGDAIEDVVVREPSLEDVFLGYAA